MKRLYYIVALALMTSCATQKPPFWTDEFGIVHREFITPLDVNYVRITQPKDIPIGCRKLRVIYLEGTDGKDYQLKYEAAKMSATHVTKEYYNNANDILGVAWDCTRFKAVARAINLQKEYRRQKAMEEIERRYIKSGKTKKLPPMELPTYVYRPGE